MAAGKNPLHTNKIILPAGGSDDLVALDDGTSVINSSGTVTGASTLAGLTDTDISSPTSAQVLIYDGSNSWDNKSLAGDVTVGATGTTAITAGCIVNADVNATAGITPGKFALTTGSMILGTANVGAELDCSTNAGIIIGDGSTAAVHALTGDVAMTNAGVTTVTGITLGSDAQGDVYYRGAAGLARLAAGSAGQALVTAGAGSNPYWGSPSIATAAGLTNNVTCEAGGSDYTLDFGTAGGAYTLTVPAVGGGRTFAFINEAQNFSANQTFDQTTLLLKGGDANTMNIKVNETLTGAKTLNIKINDTDRTIDLSGNITTANAFTTSGNFALTLTQTGATNVTLPTTGTLATLAGVETLTNKILSDSTCAWGDNGDTTKQAKWELSGATASKTMTFSSAHTDDRTITVPDATDTMALIAASQTLTNKVLSDSTCTWGDNGDTTKAATWELSGATSGKTMTISSSHTDDRTLSLPDATDTLVGKATTDVLTNKSYDCDGTGNVLTNVNANELDPITVGASTYGVPFVLTYTLTNQAAAVNIFNANAPFKFRVIDVYSVSTSADGGTWKLNNGAAGAGTDITSAVTVAASDKDIDRAVDLDDAAWDIASGGSLSVVPDAGGALDVILYITCIRVD